MAIVTKKNWRLLRQVMLWAGLPVLVWIWTEPVRPGTRALTSVVYLVFFLLAAPVWCGAANREEGTFCRNNSTGLFTGCRLQQHRGQKFLLMLRADHVRTALGSLFRNAPTGAAVVGSAAAVLSALAAWVQVLVTAG